MFKFEHLDVWEVSLELYRKVAGATKQPRQRDQVFLSDQIRRAALSISANIAEGTGRESVKEAKHFFSISKGSVYEVVSVAHVLRREDLLQPAEFSVIYRLSDRVAGMLSGLIAKR